MCIVLLEMWKIEIGILRVYIEFLHRRMILNRRV